MTLHRATRYALALAILGLPASARAQAFGLNEIGSCALARGFAVTSAPCDDGSSIYWNPGAIPRTSGFTAIRTGISSCPRKTQTAPLPLPNVKSTLFCQFGSVKFR